MSHPRSLGARILAVAVGLASAALVTVVVPGPAQAGAADLDPAFVGGGRFGYGPQFRIVSVAQDTGDDRFVAVAVRGGGTDSDRIDIRRFTPTGLADPTWNLGSPVQLGGGLSFLAPTVAVDSERGYVYVGAWSEQDQISRVWRLLPNGALDPLWGLNGRADFPGTRFTDIALARNGQVLVANANAVYRLAGNGAVDTGFGTGGGIALATGRIDSLTVHTDGDIYAAGRSAASAEVFRLTGGGALDRGFGANGRAVYRPTATLGWTISGMSLTSVVVLSSGKVVLGSGMREVSATNPAQERDTLILAGFHPGGGVDTKYRVHQDVGGAISGELARQRNDKVLVPATVGAFGRLARFLPDGAADGSFGGNGYFQDQDRGARVSAAIVQRAGRIVAVGYIEATNGALWGFQGDRTPMCHGRYATLFNGSSKSTLVGTGDDDVIVGGGGKDVVKAGKGEDRICGGGEADTIKGGGDTDQIKGDGGNDRLYGEGGVDKVKGGSGNDQLYGGPGKDKLDGGSGRNLVRQ